MTDVDEDAGPFTYVPFSTYGKKYGYLFPQRVPSGSYPASYDFEKAVSPNGIQVCTGKKGTIIFCDTSGLHCGGYARSRERIMFTAGWRSCASVMRTWVNFPPHLPETLARMGQSPVIQFAAKPNTHTRLTGFMSRRFYELTKSSDMMG